MNKPTFENIYTTYNNEIKYHITKKIGIINKELAEELTQDVFLRVHMHINNYDSNKSSIRTWLYNIANNIVVDHWRKTSLNTTSINNEDSDTKKYIQIKDKHQNPFELITSNELASKIYNAIESLSNIYKELSIMFFIEEKTYKEIVNETGLPIGTVKGQISRARKLLQSKL